MRSIAARTHGAWLTLGMAFTAGCAPQQPSRDGPATLPGYVYPAEPPLADEAGLRSLIARMDGQRTILWVFRCGSQTTGQASFLAGYRDSTRAHGTQTLGLCLDAPRRWPRVVSTLRQSGANFPCALAEPGAMEDFGRWLNEGRQPAEGLYLLDSRQRPLVRAWREFTGSDLLQATAQSSPAP